MYGKFFASTFTGSMFGAGCDVFAVWGYAIAHTVDSSVELNPAVLAAAIGTTPERVAAALDYLCASDLNSRNPAEEGRRLVREGQFQYRVVNHSAYRSVRDEDGRRDYMRDYMRKRRGDPVVNKEKFTKVNTSSQLAVLAHTEAEAEVVVTTERAVTTERVEAAGPQSDPPAAGDPSSSADFKLSGDPVPLRNDRQVKSRGKERGAAAAALAVAPDRGPVIFEFPCVPGKKKRPNLWPVYREHLDRWHFSFPDVDLEREMRKAVSWLNSHPKKTFDGMEAFFHTWLTRAQNDPKGKPNGNAVPFQSAAARSLETAARRIQRREAAQQGK